MHCIDNKHNCVLSNSGLSNALSKTGICTSLKSGFYFRFHSPSNTKSAMLNFIYTWDLQLSCWKMCLPEPDNCRTRNPHTSKISKLLRFVSQIGVDATTFLIRLQNLVKIGKELWMQYLIESKSRICTSLKSDFYFRFHSPLNTKSALPNFICTWYLLLICWKMWSPEPENCQNRHPRISKIGKLLPVCLTKKGVELTTFLSRMQHLEKIGEELWP